MATASFSAEPGSPDFCLFYGELSLSAGGAVVRQSVAGLLISSDYYRYTGLEGAPAPVAASAPLALHSAGQFQVSARYKDYLSNISSPSTIVSVTDPVSAELERLARELEGARELLNATLDQCSILSLELAEARAQLNETDDALLGLRLGVGETVLGIAEAGRALNETRDDVAELRDGLEGARGRLEGLEERAGSAETALGGLERGLGAAWAEANETSEGLERTRGELRAQLDVARLLAFVGLALGAAGAALGAGALALTRRVRAAPSAKSPELPPPAGQVPSEGAPPAEPEAAQPLCAQCGREVSPEEVSCPSCGARL